MDDKMKNKQFLVKTEDGEMKLWYPSIEDCRKNWNNAKITELNDSSYIQVVNKIISESDFLFDSDSYKKSKNGIDIYFQFLKDENDILPAVKYLIRDKSKLIISSLKTISSLEDFYNKFFKENDVEYSILFFRKNGSKNKLQKPKDLIGVKKFANVEFWKLKCELYRKNNDLYIKHKNFFSEFWSPPNDDIGKPTSYYLNKYFGGTTREKFIYPDCWSPIIFNNEAWIKFSNVFSLDYLSNYRCVYKILSDKFCERHKFSQKEYYNSEWHFFFENVSKECFKVLKGG